MLIGEVSQKTGLSRDTIRFYEKKGLIKVGRTASEWNNYKDYDADTLNILFLIKSAKGFGFTLNEIAEILDLFERDMANCTTLSVMVDEKIKLIDKKIRELKVMKKTILNKISSAQLDCYPTGEDSNCQMLSREK